jgi:hypothetical protein
MKKTTIYRVQLFNNAPKCAEAVILAAAKNNSGDYPYTLKELATYGMAYNDHSEVVSSQFEIIGENKLHIDSLIKGIWQCVAIIEEVEILETYQSNNDEEEELNHIYTHAK